MAQAPPVTLIGADGLTIASSTNPLPAIISGTGTGTVTIASSGFASSATITRTNNTGFYAATTVVGNSTASTAGVQFSGIGPSGGGEAMITSARFEIDAAALLSGETSYTLYLYNVTPPSALADTTAFAIPSGDRASFIGTISLGTPNAYTNTLNIETDIINKQVTIPNGGALFGYLTTTGSYTATASRVYIIKMHSVGL